MRKILLLFSLSLALMLTGCGGPAAPGVEDCLWTMTVVQDQTGTPIACGPEDESLWGDVPVVWLECRGADGGLTLTNHTDGAVYSGTYRLEDAKTQSVVYTVSLNGEEGMAATGITRYSQGAQEPTLVFQLGDYSLTFSGE